MTFSDASTRPEISISTLRPYQHHSTHPCNLHLIRPETIWIKIQNHSTRPSQQLDSTFIKTRPILRNCHLNISASTRFPLHHHQIYHTPALDPPLTTTRPISTNTPTTNNHQLTHPTQSLDSCHTIIRPIPHHHSTHPPPPIDSSPTTSRLITNHHLNHPTQPFNLSPLSLVSLPHHSIHSPKVPFNPPHN